MKKPVIILCLFLATISQVFSQKHLSVSVANSFIQQYPNPDTIHWKSNLNHFSWQAGYMMFTMEKLWLATKDSTYFNYIKRYVNQQVSEDGGIPDFSPDALDNFLPGYAILFMYEQTGLEKYKIAAQTLRNGFDNYKRNSDGGFWHSYGTEKQMWIDGVYMGQIFLARYAKTVGDTAYCYNEIMKQMTLIVDHCQLPNGLILHGYDESRKARWADKSTGLSPHVWSEGLGWYAVLIADALEYFPKNSSHYNTLLNILQKLCNGLKEVQDPKTGLWFQVVDKPNAPGNWNETSGSGMFTYLIQKSIKKKYIDAKVFTPVVKKAYKGLKTKAIDRGEGKFDIIDCSSIGVLSTYEAYINSPKEVNSFAPVSSYILGTLSMEFPKSLE
jgi:rhamnogalacturonyl hydrolase YesR